MSTDVPGVYAAAHKATPHLAKLLGPHTAAFTAELEVLLADPPDEAGAERLTALFHRHRGTRAYLADVLADAPSYRPAAERIHKDDARGGPLGEAGVVDPVSVWKCGACPELWYRPDAATPVPAACEACATPGLTRTAGP
ncbi:hypothetical protein ACN20G_01845 [Streptomyces sp. BI20]|uniref:hypothetical protein n=1 Tax=Streptomyces sp. BI20 TaxID=3403460 RepID=UPI003C73448D